MAGIVKTVLPPPWPCCSGAAQARRALLAAGIVELVAATLTTHAAARLSDSALLLAVELLHQLGAAIWIGGIPCFVMALARLHDGGAPPAGGRPVFPHVDGRRRLHPGLAASP